VSTDSLLDLWREGLTVCVAVCAPFLVVGLLVGLGVAVVQTATQLQESILAFVPKLLAALLVIAIGGHWALDKLANYAQRAFTAQAESRPSPAGDTVETRALQ
jgi:flagellar biosynthetic protein FliQ